MSLVAVALVDRDRSGAGNGSARQRRQNELRWEHVSGLTLGRYQHACCTVRGGVVALGGLVEAEEDDEELDKVTASVEILLFDSEADESIFKILPPLSCDPITGSAPVSIEESESEQGQVLLIGGWSEDDVSLSAVHLVALATGVCTSQPPLLSHHGHLEGCSASRLPDGCVVCVGTNHQGDDLDGTAQVTEPPAQGSPSEAVGSGGICQPRASCVAMAEGAC